MTIVWLVLFFLIGSAVGSFLNVVADRLPQEKSIVSPPSHCPKCERQLSVTELFPIFSYLWLRGRCKTCAEVIPYRLLLVELGMGVLFAFLYWRYGLGWELALLALYCSMFIALLIIDLEHGILPNKIVYPGMVFAFILSMVVTVIPLLSGWELKNSIIPTLGSAAVGGGIGFLLLLIPALIYRGGMGWGDIKLAGMMGLVSGFPLIFVAMFLAIFSGGLMAAILLVLKRKSRKDAIPFGPFLAAAAMIMLLWGNELLALLGF